MNVPVVLHGPLATHRRGKVLQEALAAVSAAGLPEGRAVLISFADAFQSAELAEQNALIEWTRVPGHLLILVPPFGPGSCERPVTWGVERLAVPPRGGEGLSSILAPEVGYRLTGILQSPALAGAKWSDLSQAVGVYRLHPAAGLFVVTSLPLWSLSVLEAPREMDAWMAALVTLAGEASPAAREEDAPLRRDHYGLLVFLMSAAFTTEEAMLHGLRSSTIFRFSPHQGNALLQELRQRGLVLGVAPTAEAQELVMSSPYAPYVRAIREVSHEAG